MDELSLGLVEREAASLDGRLVKNVTLELRGLSYEYDAVRGETGFRLGPLDLTIHPNEILFIVGGNGSGKSTLVMLLASLFVPSDGSLNLAGIEISPATTAWYRAHISVIFSDFHLFDHVFSNSNTDLQLRAEYLLQRLSLHEKVRLQDGQFSTTALSTGQRKRLALVATLLQDKPILVLDEWAADQDPSHRRFFYTELLPELKRAGKTIIVITHDEMYFDCADRIVSIVEGRMLQLNKRDANIGVPEEGKGF
jgi:cyclic peptide transporter